MTVDSLAIESLPDAGQLVVGRGRTADLRLSDQAVSPRHVRLSTSAARLTVEDLGSLAGTSLSGAPIAPRAPVAFLPGEPITLGATVLMVREVMCEERPHRIWSHGAFEVRLEEECERAGRGGAAFSVLRIAAVGPRDPATLNHVLASVAAAAPSPDAVGAYGREEYEHLLVGVDPGSAQRRFARLREVLAARGVSARAGFAHFPDDGHHAERLIACAGDRLHAEPASGAALVATAASVLSPSQEAVVAAAAGHVGPLWLVGERGVGKTTLARAIHACSARARDPFRAVSAQGQSAAGFERLLFGTAGGEGGVFGEAVGTLYLCDIDDLPAGAVLRVALGLRRAGAQAGQSPRLIVAGRRGPGDGGRPRARRPHPSELINAQVIMVPALRERRAELPELARRLAAQAARVRGRAPVAITDDGVAWLALQEWAGNVRELKNVIDHAVAAVPDGAALVEGEPAPGSTLIAIGRAELRPDPRTAVAEILMRKEEMPVGPLGGERDRIVRALVACAFNQSRAAEQLGISRRTLLTRLDRYGILRPQKNADPSNAAPQGRSDPPNPDP